MVLVDIPDDMWCFLYRFLQFLINIYNSDSVNNLYVFCKVGGTASGTGHTFLSVEIFFIFSYEN